MAFCNGLGFGVLLFSAELSSSASKGTIKGWALLHLSAGVLWFYLVILGLFFISSFAGFLPVVSWVLMDNSLIINTIHFSGMEAFSGNFCGEERHTLQAVWVMWMRWCGADLKNERLT